MSSLTMLLPPQFAVLLLVAAGFAFICQARRLGAALLVAALGMAVLPALTGPLLQALPGWALPIVALVAAFALLRALLRLAVGRGASDHAMGILAAEFVRFLVLMPFRLAAGLFALLLRQRR